MDNTVYDFLELTPFLTTLNNFSETSPLEALAKPGAKVVVAVGVPIKMFNKYANIASYCQIVERDGPVELGRLWWEDGMQNQVCHTVYLLCKDPDHAITCGFFAMNREGYFMLLGQLQNDSPFTKHIRKVLGKRMADFK